MDDFPKLARRELVRHCVHAQLGGVYMWRVHSTVSADSSSTQFEIPLDYIENNKIRMD